MKRIATIISIAFCLACNNIKQPANNKKQDTSEVTHAQQGTKDILSVVKGVQYPKIDKEGYEYGYSYKTVSIGQILLITIKEKERKMSFKLKYSIGSSKKEMIGVADLFSEGGETITDDDGTAYFITEYIYNAKGCKLRFGVDEDLKVVSIFAQSCENDKFSDFKERHILKKF